MPADREEKVENPTILIHKHNVYVCVFDTIQDIRKKGRHNCAQSIVFV